MLTPSPLEKKVPAAFQFSKSSEYINNSVLVSTNSRKTNNQRLPEFRPTELVYQNDVIEEKSEEPRASRDIENIVIQSSDKVGSSNG